MQEQIGKIKLGDMEIIICNKNKIWVVQQELEDIHVSRKKYGKAK